MLQPVERATRDVVPLPVKHAHAAVSGETFVQKSRSTLSTPPAQLRDCGPVKKAPWRVSSVVD
jgi:hypothetical protein